MDKLKAIWAKVQPLLAKVYAWSPFAVGLAAGYFGHGIIKFAVDAAAKAVKLILGL